MENKVILIASPFYGKTNKDSREKELMELKESNRLRNMEFKSLHRITDFYYIKDAESAEKISFRLMIELASADYVIIDISNADTTTGIIIGMIDRINAVREEENKITILAYAEDERIYDNELYGLIYTPVGFDQFLVGTIDRNGCIFRTYHLLMGKLKRISKDLRIKKQQEERELKKLAKEENNEQEE